MPVRRCLRALVFVTGAFLLATPVASASLLTVSSTSDSGAGSLRATVAAASSNDTIRIPAGTYALSSAITLDKPLTLEGDGARLTVLDGKHATQIIHVAPSAEPGVTISSMTLINGTAPTGGAIQAAATLTLTDDAILESTATSTDGGGIWTTAPLMMDRDLVRHDVSAKRDGGGIELVASAATISNSTIFGNSTSHVGGGIATGFGVTLTLNNDTIYLNSSFGGGSGGNIALGTLASLVLRANAIGAGLAAAPSDCSLPGTTIYDAGYNVEEATGECLDGGTDDLIVPDLQLQSVQDNGGPIDTFLPAPGSPLVNAGGASGCTATDQRGVPRPQGSACDAGAVEVTVRPPSVGAATVSAIGATSATIAATVDPVFVGGTTHVAYGVTSASGAVTPDQALLGGVGPQPVTVTMTGLTPLTTYHAQLAIHTGIGDATSKDISFTTSAAPPVIQPPNLTPPHATPTLRASPPRLASARLTHKRFRIAKRATAVAATTPLGTAFAFTLVTSAHAPATVRIAIARSQPGLRKGRRCVAPSAKLRRAHARKCTRSVAGGTLTRNNLPGQADRVAFSGRVGRRALKPGRYVATLTARNAAGGSPPVRLRFTVVR